MNTYKVYIEWSGYSRGTQTLVLDANSEDEARNEWHDAEVIDFKILRDNTEKEVVSVELVSEE